jgi:hypothetical protein
MAETFRTLKELAIANGTGPTSVTDSYAMFLSTGALGKPKEGARKKLGLEPLPQGGGDAVARLLGGAVGDAGVPASTSNEGVE